MEKLNYLFGETQCYLLTIEFNSCFFQQALSTQEKELTSQIKELTQQVKEAKPDPAHQQKLEKDIGAFEKSKSHNYFRLCLIYSF